MQTWFSQSLGDGLMAFEPKDALREQFERQYPQAERPVEAAVFTRHELEGRLQCEVIAYFSPAAQALARSVGARPCERPSTQDLDLLAGDGASWTALFPDGA